MKVSKFSIDWLEDFKKRHNIKKHKQHEKLDSVQRESIEKKLMKLRQKFENYHSDDIYNINETDKLHDFSLLQSINVFNSQILKKRIRYHVSHRAIIRWQVRKSTNYDRFHL